MTLTKPRVLVIGDEMIDWYYFGKADRISPEAPIPVVKVFNSMWTLGGAANVWQNLRSLGMYTKLISGDIEGCLITDRIRKSRLMVGDVQVARWDERDNTEPIEVNRLDKVIQDWSPDAIVISDYDKGSITEEVITWVAAKAIPLFVDTKRPPFDFPRTATFFPNQKEYEARREAYDWLEKVVLKRGANGIADLCKGKIVDEYTAKASYVRSVCGAGDVVLAAYVAATLRGKNSAEALWYANLAAAVAVEQPYTAVVRPEQIEAKAKEVARVL